MSDADKNITTSTASTNDIEAIAGLQNFCDTGALEGGSFVSYLESQVRKNKSFEGLKLDPSTATWTTIFNTMDSKSMFWIHLGDHGYYIENDLEQYFGYKIYGELMILKSRDITNWICIIFHRASTQGYIMYRTYHTISDFTGWLGDWKRLSYTSIDPNY